MIFQKNMHFHSKEQRDLFHQLIENQLNAWELAYLLKSNLAGTCVYKDYLNENMQRLCVIRVTQPHMVGGTFVAEEADGGQGIVMREIAFVPEDRLQHPRCCRVFNRPVKLGVQVGGGEMHTAVGGIGARGYGTGVGGPHAGGTIRGRQQNGIPFCGLLNYL